MKNSLLAIASLLAIQGTIFAKTVIVTEADSQKTVTLQEGDTLRVALKGNPSTGYAWEISSNDESVLEMSGKCCRPIKEKKYKPCKENDCTTFKEKDGKQFKEKSHKSFEDECYGSGCKRPKKNLCGAPCCCVFTFQPTATKGTSNLELVYVRPWQTGSTPSSTFQLTVVSE